jgi:hypothetical protein
MGVPEALRNAIVWGDMSGIVLTDERQSARTNPQPSIAVSAIPYLGK